MIPGPWKIAKNTNLSEDWVRSNKAKNETKNILRNAKANFIKENMNKHLHDSKKFWEQMSLFLMNSEARTNINLKDQESGQVISQANTSDYIGRTTWRLVSQ